MDLANSSTTVVRGVVCLQSVIILPCNKVERVNLACFLNRGKLCSSGGKLHHGAKVRGEVASTLLDSFCGKVMP